ncbi:MULTISPECIES: Imm1 family immunity protein [unclassified Microcoleus]|uniref:Imm1 family immunity protein n=1 Tax=unclassified Microcoleus TaxID=2642155 RepID=UPI002FCF8EA7
MFVLNLSAENWVGNQDECELIESPTWNQIEKALRDLNGKTKTLVTLGADDESYMSIGGGESGKYIVNITFDNVSFYNLVEPSKPDAIEKLVVGGQEGNYSAKMCVNLETALLAAQTFTASGELQRSLSWEEEKELAVSSNKI